MKSILTKKNVSYFIEILVLLIGCFGILRGLIISLVFPRETLLSLIPLTIIAVVLFNLVLKKKKIFKVVMMIEISIMVILIVLFIPLLTELIFNLSKVIQENSFLKFDELIQTNSFGISFFFMGLYMLLGVPIVTLLVSIGLHRKKTLFKLFFVTLIMFFPSFILHNLDYLSCYCVILFVLYEYVFAHAFSYQRHYIIPKVTIVSSLVIVMFFSTVFLEGNPLFNEKTSDVLTRISEWIDSSQLDGLSAGKSVTGVSSRVDGKLPTGSVSLNDNIAMEVTASEPITTYIRGYSLAHYSKNIWSSVHNPYTRIDSLSLLPAYLYQRETGQELNNISIETKKRTVYQFVPYFTMQTSELIDDSYYKVIENNKLKVINSDLSSFEQNFELNDYDNNSDYTSYVKKEYLDVSDELKKNLLSFVEDNYKDEFVRLSDDSISLESKVEIIKDILSRETRYDLNSGILPNGKDFVEHFLFENKKGSCTHYASTATLLLRCFHIPTRYTTGFVMKKTDFKDGKATIKNNRSHAWIEVYYEGYGWFPYEMTPTVNGGDATIGSIGDMLDDQLSLPPLEPNETPQESTQTPQTPSVDNKENPVDGEEASYIDLSEYKEEISIGLGVILCLFLYRIMTRQVFFLLQKRKTSNQQIISYYLRMKRMQKFGSVIDSKMREYVLKAQFSRHILDNELIEVKEYYLRFNLELYQQLSWYKKIVYKFIYGYI